MQSFSFIEYEIGQRNTNAATAVQTTARITKIINRSTRTNIRIINIIIRIVTTTIIMTPMRILQIPNTIIKMITKIINRTTTALAKLSRSPPSTMVRPGMP